jgi:hypothetical protein
MNLIEKLHALMVSDAIHIWHYSQARPPAKPFVFWLPDEPDNREGHGFDSFEEMIEAAYAHIDPLKVALPDAVRRPEQAAR